MFPVQSVSDVPGSCPLASLPPQLFVICIDPTNIRRRNLRVMTVGDMHYATTATAFSKSTALENYFAVTGVSVTGPSRPQSVSGQLEASKGL